MLIVELLTIPGKITCVVLKYIVYQIIQIIFRILSDEFEDTKEVIVICKSTKDRQQNGRKKKDKKINNDLQNIHIKLKIEQQASHQKPG
jgi:hypothetical protein